MENQIWLAIVALVASASTITEFFKRIFKVDKPWFNELLSFIISIGTAFVAWILGTLPTWFTPEWQCVIIEGIILFLINSKVFYDKLYLVQEIFDVVFSLFGNKLGGKWYSKVEEKKE
ncbi:MAG: hypothetical protein J6W77_05355 [Prevotella sp.]|nr:hypothetical protein [Prevotella sp.]